VLSAPAYGRHQRQHRVLYARRQRRPFFKEAGQGDLGLALPNTVVGLVTPTRLFTDEGCETLAWGIDRCSNGTIVTDQGLLTDYSLYPPNYRQNPQILASTCEGLQVGQECDNVLLGK
jgi:hypothetical protein